ncbi:3-hydroxyacyl-CoA dehydrogenase [Neorhizobium sp. P12A]|uniref:3-hydroxyacyl-CoA dehydrogenase n=1 Tax=Neorhizobium sp. P12A TaxID=2268027 RepID=UPI0011EF2780|nr:3-hydroxyacyl-CoA dehydrogenase [Neorhizobium sp. P12A]KAA0692018.1 3-hydroxyacyl-CoA dehydrogenase [Neorhizobium sp. P12A]
MSGGKVAIVGAGLVGSAWALVFARSGFEVSVFDPSKEVSDRVLGWMAQELSSLHDLGLAGNVDEILSRVTLAKTLAEAVEDAIYVQESVFETVEAKIGISMDIDALLPPDACVGSSSSGIPASKFTEGCRNRERFLIAHPVNPPHLVPVVELVPAPWTMPKAVETCRALMADIGQVPVQLKREVDGFILNRLQGALLNEAWALYAEGYADLADIDATVSQGLGLRWSFMGPFETIDLNAPGGIADYARRLSPMYHQMALSRRDPARWSNETVAAAEKERRQSLKSEDLGERRRWRDHKLAQLSAFKTRVFGSAKEPSQS